MLKIGILGVGAIGRVIAKALDEHQLDAELVALADQDRARAETLSAELLTHPPVTCIDEMIEPMTRPLNVKASVRAPHSEAIAPPGPSGPSAIKR